MTPYLIKMKDYGQRKLLTKYRLSEQSLSVETGRHKQSWRARELNPLFIINALCKYLPCICYCFLFFVCVLYVIIYVQYGHDFFFFFLTIYMLYNLVTLYCFGNTVLFHSHANKAHLNWNWNWIERERERGREREREREEIADCAAHTQTCCQRFPMIVINKNSLDTRSLHYIPQQRW